MKLPPSPLSVVVASLATLFLFVVSCARVRAEDAGKGRAEASASAPYQSAEGFEAYAKRLREETLRRVGPQVTVGGGGRGDSGRYPWKRSIMTTVFWVGETPTENNPVTNEKSAWDVNWNLSYGGCDSPTSRSGFLPAGFVPKQNPFYVALPYNDVEGGQTKAEAEQVIPWFRREFREAGKSVVRGRWLAIRAGRRVCYAQWEDVGPFRTDHWQYVFGNERPTANLNDAAGLDVSPAVRDYLGLKGKSLTDWKFVEDFEVPPGPWRSYGDNNIFARRQIDTEKARTNEGEGKQVVQNEGAKKGK